MLRPMKEANFVRFRWYNQSVQYMRILVSFLDFKQVKRILDHCPRGVLDFVHLLHQN